MGQGEQVSCPAGEKVPAAHRIGDVFVVGHLYPAGHIVCSVACEPE